MNVFIRTLFWTRLAGWGSYTLRDWKRDTKKKTRQTTLIMENYGEMMQCMKAGHWSGKAEAGEIKVFGKIRQRSKEGVENKRRVNYGANDVSPILVALNIRRTSEIIG